MSRDEGLVGPENHAGWRAGGAWSMTFLALPILLTSLAETLWPRTALPALVNWLGYSFFCWITIYVLWRWAAARGVASDIFAFARPSVAHIGIALGGAALGILVIWPASQWLAHVLGTGVRGMNFDLAAPLVLPSVVVWAIISAPFCEEILFRGLAWHISAGGAGRPGRSCSRRAPPLPQSTCLISAPAWRSSSSPGRR